MVNGAVEYKRLDGFGQLIDAGHAVVAQLIDIARGLHVEIPYVFNCGAAFQKTVQRGLGNPILGRHKQLIERVTGQVHRHGNNTVGEFIDLFVSKTLNERRINTHPLSERTLSEYTRLYKNIKANIGGEYFDSITQDRIKALLNELCTTNEVFNKYRTRLVDLWRHAVDDGLTATNIPANILPKDKEAKKRKRITLPGDRPGVHGINGIEAYNAIFDHASPAIQRAMELCLNYIQRREEIYRWRRDWLHEGYVYIRISKTHKSGRSSYIRISVQTPTVYSRLGATTLGELIKACLKGTVCPYLVYQRPKRSRPSKEKKHVWQLSPSQISRGFANAREASGLYDHLPKEERPTFHELISLGQVLRSQQGWTENQIKTLRGHSKMSTALTYFEGHEWTDYRNAENTMTGKKSVKILHWTDSKKPWGTQPHGFKKLIW